MTGHTFLHAVRALLPSWRRWKGKLEEEEDVKSLSGWQGEKAGTFNRTIQAFELASYDWHAMRPIRFSAHGHTAVYVLSFPTRCLT